MSSCLVVQLARMGDLVQTKRLLLSTLQDYVEVHLCVDFSLKDFAQKLYPFAQIHPIPAHGGANSSLQSTLELSQKCFAELKSIPFFKVYTLNSSALSFAIARLFPENIVTGFGIEKLQNIRSPWVKLARRWTGERQSSPINLVDYWAHFHRKPIAPELVNPVAKASGNHSIGLVMAGRVARRSLPPKALALCLEAIFRARSAPNIICLGSKTETPLVRQLARLLPSQVAEKLIDRTGQTSLVDLPEILQSLDMVITPDTGIMHLAAHLGVPVQAFFLSSAWCFETGPYGLGHKVWQSSIPCAPCLESAPCPNNEICLHDFLQPSFINHLAGKYTENFPKHLTGYVTGFDELGIVYKAVDGKDAQEEKRTLLRCFVAEQLHLGRATGLPTNIAESILQESDWILAKEKQC